MPVQLIPYAGLGQEKIRKIINGVIGEMVQRGMDVSGEFFFGC